MQPKAATTPPPPRQTIPEISTLPWFTLFAPLVCLLLIRATRDLVDDIVSGCPPPRSSWARDGPGCPVGRVLTAPSLQGRHRSDRTVNNRPCQILLGKG